MGLINTVSSSSDPRAVVFEGYDRKVHSTRGTSAATGSEYPLRLTVPLAENRSPTPPRQVAERSGMAQDYPCGYASGSEECAAIAAARSG